MHSTVESQQTFFKMVAEKKKRSGGPRTERGKAISSRNALKHGLRSEQPPILASESLQTFQELVQGLVDEYQPRGASEFLLIETVALSWQKLRRVWAAEAAAGDRQMAEAELAAKYPEDEESTRFESGEHAERFSKITLNREIHLIKKLSQDLKFYISGLPKSDRHKWVVFEDAVEWREELQAVLSDFLKHYPKIAIDPSIDPIKDKQRLEEETFVGRLCKLANQSVYTWYLQQPVTVIRRDFENLFNDCNQRLDYVRAVLSDIERLEQKQQGAAIALASIPQNIELLSRYERSVHRNLTEALDRLNQIKESRQNEASSRLIGNSGVPKIIQNEEDQ